jgi:hypothetical protein
MAQELICEWLKLEAGSWPPDHYTLLGLKPGEWQLERIEHEVRERMEKVRHYQLTHPEAATEAMNRLAQALVCLTDIQAKKAYDASLDGPSPTGQVLNSPEPETSEERTASPFDPLAWLFGPWNSPVTEQPPASSEQSQTVANWETAPPPARIRPPTDPAPGAQTDTVVDGTPLIDPTSTGADGEPQAAGAGEPTTENKREPAWLRRGLGTKRALYARIARTRQLLWAWQQAGKYMNRPTRLLHRPSEATELIRHMHAIRELLRGFPSMLGEAGQPGYLVLALARQQMIVPTLQTLLPSQREALARDWQAGHEVLKGHRQFLREELGALRRRSRWRQSLRAVWTTLSEYPGFLLFLVSLEALDLTVPQVHATWPWQVLGVSVIVLCRGLWWWASSRPVKLPPGQPSMPPKRKTKSAVKGPPLPNSSGA